MYHDIQGSYNIGPNVRVSLGVNNLTDETAPVVYGGFNGSTDMRTYDVIGRFFYTRAEVKF